jgi:VWFA-related protein
VKSKLVATGVVMAALAGLVPQARESAPAGQRPTFRGGTTLVQLDVVVTDASGKAVSGLIKDDFKILDGGKERPVVAVNEYHHPLPAAGSLSSDVATTAIDRLVGIVLDDHSRPDQSVQRAKETTRELIKALAGRAHLALIRTSRQPGVEFTSNAQDLLDALDAEIPVEEQIQRPSMDWSSLNSLLNKDRIHMVNDPAAEPLTRLETDRSPGRTRGGAPVSPIPDTLYNAFSDGLLSANDGRRKAFIVVTEGAFHTRLTGLFLDDEVKRFEQGKLTDVKLLDDVHERLQAVFRAAARTNSSVSIVDPRLAGTDRRISETGVARLQRAALDALANVSGGFSAIRTESLDDTLSRVMSDLDDYYVLGFEPADPQSTKLRELEVQTRTPGLVVRSRTNYQLDEKAQRAVAAAAKKDPLLGLAYSPIPAGDLALRLWAAVLAPVSPSSPGSIALWIDSGTARLTEYAVFSIDMVNRREARPPVGRKLTGAPPSLLRLETPVLRPGRYQLRVGAVGDTGSGSVYQTIVIPDFSTMPLAVAGLVLGTETVRRADAAPLPFTPTLERVFAPRTRLRVGFQVWQLAVSGDVQTVVEIVDTARRTVSQIEQVLRPQEPRTLSLDLRLPEAPGVYLIRARASDGRLRASEDITIRIKPAG